MRSMIMRAAGNASAPSAWFAAPAPVTERVCLVRKKDDAPTLSVGKCNRCRGSSPCVVDGALVLVGSWLAGWLAASRLLLGFSFSAWPRRTGEGESGVPDGSRRF